MRVAIVAASGQTGTHLIEQALEAGHSVIGLARTPENIKSTDERVIKRHGDAFDRESIIDGLEGADAVITSVGKRDLLDKRYKLSTIAHEAVLAGMRKHGIKRLLVISSTGAPPLKRDGIQRNIYLFLRRKYYRDMYEMESQVMDSGLDVTVLRAPFLVEGERTGKYRVIEDENYPVGINISRSNLAHFLINELDNPQWNRRVIAVAEDTAD
jgi:putative NADH-flavin reductase